MKETEEIPGTGKLQTGGTIIGEAQPGDVSESVRENNETIIKSKVYEIALKISQDKLLTAEEKAFYESFLGEADIEAITRQLKSEASGRQEVFMEPAKNKDIAGMLLRQAKREKAVAEQEAIRAEEEDAPDTLIDEIAELEEMARQAEEDEHFAERLEAEFPAAAPLATSEELPLAEPEISPTQEEVLAERAAVGMTSQEAVERAGKVQEAVNNGELTFLEGQNRIQNLSRFADEDLMLFPAEAKISFQPSEVKSIKDAAEALIKNASKADKAKLQKAINFLETRDAAKTHQAMQILEALSQDLPSGVVRVSPAFKSIKLYSFGGAIMDALSGKNRKKKPKSAKVQMAIGLAHSKNLNPVDVPDANLIKFGLSPDEIVEYRKFAAPGTDLDYSDKVFKLPHDPSAMKGMKDTADMYLGVISTRLGNIDKRIRDKTRHMIFKTMTHTHDDVKSVESFIVKFKALPSDVQFDLTKHLNNGDNAAVNKILRQHGMDNGNVLKVLREIRERAVDAGFDIGFLENYFPRIVRDFEGLMMEIRQTEMWTPIDQAIKEKEQQLGQALTEDQKAEVANRILKGFIRSPHTDPTHTKARRIRELSDKLNAYYAPADKALMIYIRTMNSAIEKRKFFGGRSAVDSTIMQIDPEFQSDEQFKQSLGDLIQRLESQGIKLDTEQTFKLKSMLDALFNPQATAKGVKKAKDIIYATTLTNPIAALTQIGDLALSAEKSGFGNTLRALTTKSEVTPEDIGVSGIAHELDTDEKTAEFLNKWLVRAGFTAVDRLGKTTAINASLQKLRKQAKAGDTGLIQKLQRMFDVEAQGVLEDLKSGEVTENVRFLLFNELSDLQPITRLEVPEKYLRVNHGKVFYALKTFQIKLLDIYRNEIYNEYQKGDKKKALKKLVSLTTALAIVNGSVDELKDFILGRDVTWTDRTIDTLLRLGGMSKFVIWKARREGAYSAVLNLFAPPFGMLNDITRDVGLGAEKALGLEEEGKEQSFRTPKYIPFGGKLYYWWGGRGKDIAEKQLTEILHDRIAEAEMDGDSDLYMKSWKRALDEGIEISQTKIRNRQKEKK